jgi:hypothetical protein
MPTPDTTGQKFFSSTVIGNDTTTSVTLSIGTIGEIYMTGAIPSSDTGDIAYDYAYVYGRVYNSTDGWITGNAYNQQSLYSAGGVPSSYNNVTTYWPYVAVLNSHVTTDDHQWGVTRIRYHNMTNGDMSWIVDEFASANDTNTIPSGYSYNYGDLDGYPPYAWIQKCAGSVQGTAQQSHLYLVVSGQGATNFANGTRFDQYYW